MSSLLLIAYLLFAALWAIVTVARWVDRAIHPNRYPRRRCWHG